MPVRAGRLRQLLGEADEPVLGGRVRERAAARFDAPEPMLMTRP